MDGYIDIPKERLDEMWRENKQQLACRPKNWDLIRLEVLLENEYDRRCWEVPQIN